jgi:hypothetical protein
VALSVVLIVGGGWSLQRRAQQAEAALRVWYRDLPTARELAREHGRPLHVHFTSAAAPLATRMDEALALAPVRQLAEARFVNLRLDAGTNAALFRRLMGSAGVLGSCVVDVGEQDELDPVAVAPGYLDGQRYLELLAVAAETLPRLRELRARQDDAARLALGDLYASQGSKARARVVLAEVKAEGPRSSALEALARLDVEAGHIAQARRELDEAKKATTQPRSVRLWLTEALVLSAERRVSESIAMLRAGLAAAEVGDERARALLLLAQLEHELKQDGDALHHLELLEREQPNGPWSRLAAERIGHVKNPQPDHQH